MGSNVYITRRTHWWDRDKPITLPEWLAIVESDPQLELRSGREMGFAVWNGPTELQSAWLDWDDGNIHTKNPDAALIDKMIGLAQGLAATVQGEDGETYELGGSQRPAPAPSPWRRILAYLGNLWARCVPRDTPAPLSLHVGDRVKDSWDNEGIIVSIDPGAEHGLGRIRVRFDDGRCLDHSVVAFNLLPVATPPDDETQ